MLCKNILDSIGHTPLVRLNRLTTGFDAEVYVKADYMNPGGPLPSHTRLRLRPATGKGSSPVLRLTFQPVAESGAPMGSDAL